MSSNVSPPLAPPSITCRDDDHYRAMRRIFIGPMPERVAAAGVATNDYIYDDDGENNENLSGFIREHAYRFFLQHGGRREDWGDAAERGAREDMLRRWRASEWRSIRRKGRKQNQGTRWIGGTFEVGSVMGINVLHVQEETQSRRATSLSSPSVSTPKPPLTASTAGTFVTAKSDLTNGSVHHAEEQDQRDLLQVPNGHSDDSHRISASSSTPLLLETSLSQNGMDDSERPIPFRDVKSDSNIQFAPPMRSILMSVDKGKGRGKGKAVHYREHLTAPVIEEEPLPPGEVLARTGSAVDETSAGAAVTATLASDAENTDKNDVSMRDRMLVRVSHIEHENVGRSLDETEGRTMRGLQHEDWGEFLVVWRKHYIEIYEDYFTPGKEWAFGHKHLVFLIPLRDQSTKLSLYSPVDLTFCLVCRPTSVAAGRTSKRRVAFHKASRGMNIFVFKNKSRSRGVDWMWQLWSELGSEIPRSFDIHCSALDTRVTIDISKHSGGYRQFSRDAVIDTCRKALSKLPDWDYIFQQPMMKGKSLELCWRTETKLDWIWLDDDIDGKHRDWEVLFGLALKYPGRPTHLEIRLAEHYSTHLTLNDGTHLHEPPSIEGYLQRIKPNSQSKTPVYLTSHDGFLFSLRPSRAHPPNPPGALPVFTAPDEEPETLREAEIRRGWEQIMSSDGFCDLRSILVVRRAFQPTVRSEEGFQAEGTPTGGGDGVRKGMRRDGDAQISWPDIERVGSDDEDQGGDEGLAKTQDKVRLRMRRSFELLLRSGHVIRFEAHSCKAALEWITNLRVLISYWTLRHRTDARSEMELLHASTGQQRLTVTKHVRNRNEPPELPPDPDAAAPFLGSFWHWCVLDGCRPIIKSGRIFVKQGLRGQYRHVQLILVSGHLIQFHLVRHTHMHHHRSHTVSLLDAYVCSGYFAALALPRGEYRPDIPPVARIFQDGLQTADADEDTLFIVWFCKYASGKASPYIADERDGKKTEETAIPRLSTKRKVLVCRARSKLERDAWCWALNCEIERVVRATKAREQRAREEGALVNL